MTRDEAVEELLGRIGHALERRTRWDGQDEALRRVTGPVATCEAIEGALRDFDEDVRTMEDEPLLVRQPRDCACPTWPCVHMIPEV